MEGGGKDLGAGELLALQAGVYRYSEAVDLSAKLIESRHERREDRPARPVSLLRRPALFC